MVDQLEGKGHNINQGNSSVKDALKSNFKELEIDLDNLDALSGNRVLWKKLIRVSCGNLEPKWMVHAALKRSL